MNIVSAIGWAWLLVFAGLIIGTVGWLGDILDIRPWWFEVAGAVITLPSALYIKWVTRRWARRMHSC